MTTQKFLNKKFALVLLSLLCTFGLGHAAADSSLQSVVQSYSSKATIQKGMIVRLIGQGSSQVEVATLAKAQAMTGVVVSPNDAPLSLSSQNSNADQIYVATSGRYSVLVSNQDGPISAGDYVTISSLDGVGMKADEGENTILGKAAGSFDGVHGIEGSATARNKNGKSSNVAIGRITVDIAIGPNPLALKSANVPGFLQHATLLITDKPVDPWRIYIGLVIIAGSMLVAGSLLYGGVHSGMVAVGRNPLARPSILRNLLQVVLASITVFIVGLAAVYLLIKL